MTGHSNARKSGPTKLNRIGLRAKSHLDTMFNNLGHVITVDLLREAYHELGNDKASGIDNVTKGAYGAKLDENISDLIIRIRRGQYKPKAARIQGRRQHTAACYILFRR